MITVDQFKTLFPHAVGDPFAWVNALQTICPRYGINTPERMVHFLAQCGHESAGFSRLLENLNYSATGLIQTWPRRFTPDMAQSYARQPERIANYVYANRLGNGDQNSGDGWRYRGAGIIQLTGKSNHQAFADAIDRTLEDATAYLHTINGAVESACWYWHRAAVNTLADNGDVKNLTVAINGGYNGLAERYQLTERVREVLA